MGLILAFSVTAAGPSWGGACQNQIRTYCVAGSSTPLDWSWDVDGTTSTVAAMSGGLLSNGDPASAIVGVFVTDLTNNAIVATTNTANTCSTCNACLDGFDLDTCTQLSVNGTIVPAGPGLSFNPIITLPEPGAGLSMLGGAMLMQGLLAIRKRTAVSVERTRRGRS